MTLFWKSQGKTFSGVTATLSSFRDAVTYPPRPVSRTASGGWTGPGRAHRSLMMQGLLGLSALIRVVHETSRGHRQCWEATHKNMPVFFLRIPPHRYINISTSSALYTSLLRSLNIVIVWRCYDIVSEGLLRHHHMGCSNIVRGSLHHHHIDRRGEGTFIAWSHTRFTASFAVSHNHTLSLRGADRSVVAC